MCVSVGLMFRFPRTPNNKLKPAMQMCIYNITILCSIDFRIKFCFQLKHDLLTLMAVVSKQPIVQQRTGFPWHAAC